ncbi:MAG: ISAs1 family transposase [Anaerolineae bacterium]|nr:ISAs1 family transposase [Anaerolineae bacterium]
MQYSTLSSDQMTAVGPVVFEVRSLWRRLEALSDRRHRQGKRYPLPLILLFVVLAKLCGEDRPSGIAEWVRHRREQLGRALGMKLARVPHHNTYRRVLAGAVCPEELDRAIGAFLQESPQAGLEVLISIDGKTIRGTVDAQDPEGLKLLVACLPQKGIALLQVALDPHTNEISAAPVLLAGLDLEGKIVTADALHTQRALSTQVLEAGGQYLWLVKDNQPALRADIEELFSGDDRTVEGGRLGHDFARAQQVDKGHGRRERRRITVSGELKGYSDWPGLEQVFQLERERVQSKTGKHEHEIVYGVTSLTADQASPERLLELTRAYWGVENGLHYRRDVTFREDATRLTQGQAGHVMASLNNLVIGLLRLAGFTNLAAARRYCAAHLAYALALLTSSPQT